MANSDGFKPERKCRTFSASLVSSNNLFCLYAGIGAALSHVSFHILPGCFMRKLKCPSTNCEYMIHACTCISHLTFWVGIEGRSRSSISASHPSIACVTSMLLFSSCVDSPSNVGSSPSPSSPSIQSLGEYHRTKSSNVQ